MLLAEDPARYATRELKLRPLIKAPGVYIDHYLKSESQKIKQASEKFLDLANNFQ